MRSSPSPSRALAAGSDEAKLVTLRDLFGTDDVTLEPERLSVGGRAYPIVDDVIVLLDPSHYPASLRQRLGRGAPGRDPAVPYADDIQSTFGAEWRSYPSILPEHEQEFRKYFDLVDLEELRDRRVCDLGCGIGRWSYFLKDRCRELVLVDFSDAILVARENLRGASNVLFFMGDLQRLPFRDDFADVMFSLGVLHHLPTDALAEVRRLRRFAPKLLVYLYYALDNRPPYFRWLLALVTAARRPLWRVRSPFVRSAVVRTIAASVYLPLVTLGRLLAPLGLGRWVPLYELYHRRSWKGICQDVYDRFFTRIEQRFSRKEISTLRDTFRRVTVSEGLPYWHFLCER